MRRRRLAIVGSCLLLLALAVYAGPSKRALTLLGPLKQVDGAGSGRDADSMTPAQLGAGASS
jgi:hypothetical protein